VVFWNGEAGQDPRRSDLMRQTLTIELANRLPERLLMPWFLVSVGASFTPWIFEDGVAA